MSVARVRALTPKYCKYFALSIFVEMSVARVRALTPIPKPRSSSLIVSVEMSVARVRALTRTNPIPDSDQYLVEMSVARVRALEHYSR